MSIYIPENIWTGTADLPEAGLLTSIILLIAIGLVLLNLVHLAG
ncbi:MAG: hypothetical protein P8Y14_17225 [Anaerolineales bacterium]